MFDNGQIDRLIIVVERLAKATEECVECSKAVRDIQQKHLDLSRKTYLMMKARKIEDFFKDDN